MWCKNLLLAYAQLEIGSACLVKSCAVSAGTDLIASMSCLQACLCENIGRVHPSGQLTAAQLSQDVSTWKRLIRIANVGTGSFSR